MNDALRQRIKELEAEAKQAIDAHKRGTALQSSAEANFRAARTTVRLVTRR